MGVSFALATNTLVDKFVKTFITDDRWQLFLEGFINMGIEVEF